MSSRLLRASMFVGYIWSDIVNKALVFILGFIGFVQVIAPLLMQEPIEGGRLSWWEEILAFFTTRWLSQTWVMVLLSSFLFISIRSLWKLGGFDLRIGLQLQSEPLTDGDRRFLGLSITNLSPRDIQQLFVRIEGLKRLDEDSWTPSSLIGRRDKFWWTSWEPPRQGTKTLVSGYEIIADMLVMQRGLDIAVFLLQAQTLYLYVDPGTYQVDTCIVGVYSGRRVEIPMSFEFDYGGDMDISNVRPARGERRDWRIEGHIEASVLPPPRVGEIARLQELLKRLEDDDNGDNDDEEDDD